MKTNGLILTDMLLRSCPHCDKQAVIYRDDGEYADAKEPATCEHFNGYDFDKIARKCVFHWDDVCEDCGAAIPEEMPGYKCRQCKDEHFSDWDEPHTNLGRGV